MNQPDPFPPTRGATPPPVAQPEAGSEPRAEAGALPQRARAFSAPLLAEVLLDSGEPALLHADAVQAILAAIGADEATRAKIRRLYASAQK